jgi:hypothetical protein
LEKTRCRLQIERIKGEEKEKEGREKCERIRRKCLGRIRALAFACLPPEQVES